MAQSHTLLGLLSFACAATVGCASGAAGTPIVADDASQGVESGTSTDSTTTAEDDSSSADSTPDPDSTVDADSSADDGSSVPGDGSIADGAVPDDTAAPVDTGALDDSANADGAGDAEVGSDAGIGLDTGEAGSDASDAGSDATQGGPDASDAGSDATEAGSDASEAGADAAPCMANILTPSTAVASSALQLASNAIDGIFATRWESVHGMDPQSIYVDFGAPVFVSRVQIAWETDCAKNYALQVSNDLAAWTTMTSIVGNTNGGLAPVDWTTAANHPVLSGVGRYLRINGTVRCTANGYSIWEMRVFGDTNASCHP